MSLQVALRELPTPAVSVSRTPARLSSNWSVPSRRRSRRAWLSAHPGLGAHIPTATFPRPSRIMLSSSASSPS
jgi:hypothetical protein